MQKTKENKGITLIALVITIIVLLILAGVSISMLAGDNGVLTKSTYSKFASEVSAIKEQVDLKNMVEDSYYTGSINEFLGITSEYNDRLILQEGELVYVADKLSSKEAAFCEQIEIKKASDYYTVEFDSAGGEEIESQSIKIGRKATRPTNPTKSGHVFLGWYYIEEGGTEENPTYTEKEFDFNTAIMSNYALYAKYTGEAIIMVKNENKAFWQERYRTNIADILFTSDSSKIPNTTTSWNIRANANCADIMAYLTTDGTKLVIYSASIIYANPNSENCFRDFSNLKTITFDNFNTSKVKYMNSMFRECRELIDLDVSTFDTSKVNKMNSMFTNCSKLGSLNLSSFNTEKVTNMEFMFLGCNELTNVNLSNFNTSNVLNMTQMFSNCNFIDLNLSNFDTSKVESMKGMFYSCSSLTSIDLSNFDTRNVKDMNLMFFNCILLSNLDLSSFNTEKVTDMGFMFYNCRGITNLNLSGLNTSNVTNMEKMFWYCNGYTSLDLSSFNTSKVENMNLMFYANTKLETLYVGQNWNTSLVTDSEDMFNLCIKLTGSEETKYKNENPKDKTYAHIDGGELNPGYLTLKINN